MFDALGGFFDFLELFSGLILFFLGCLATACFFYEWHRSYWVSWCKVKGVMAASEIEEKYNSYSENTALATTYFPLIRYEYDVSGKKNIGKKLYSGLDFSASSKAYAAQVTNEYSLGKVVDVFYNAKRPEDSCLRVRMHISSWFSLLLGAVFFVVSYFVLAVW